MHPFVEPDPDDVSALDLLERSPSGRLDEGLAVHVALQVARTLSEGARSGLVHRAVKPRNVRIGRHGAVRLCDGGLTTSAAATATASGARTIVGSPHYVSPEQVQAGALDERADVYSLGATLFHLVTGRPPFLGPTPEEVCLKHLTEAVPDPRALNPAVTPRLAAELLHMLAKDRGRRSASCAEVVRALEEVARAAGGSGEDERTTALARLVAASAPTRRA